MTVLLNADTLTTVVGFCGPRYAVYLGRGTVFPMLFGTAGNLENANLVGLVR